MSPTKLGTAEQQKIATLTDWGYPLSLVPSSCIYAQVGAKLGALLVIEHLNSVLLDIQVRATSPSAFDTPQSDENP